MKTVSANFFQFAGIHSLLIGLLPFFIPVLLLQRGASIEGIALFIALTGIGFIISLKVWERLYCQANWRIIIGTSFVVEILLVAALLFTGNTLFLLCAALLNGAYNCFYWTTQRVLFSTMTAKDEAQHTEQESQPYQNQTGRKFGNFQILVVILLKLGIVAGAFLLEEGYRYQLWFVSTLISVAGVYWFFRVHKIYSFARVNQLLPMDANSNKQTTASIFSFKDEHNSAVVFYLDGIFLFLESYFWVVSLFFIAQENIKELGIVIVLLTVFLSVIFYLLKNRIDGLDRKKVYLSAVVLYALSWWLRGMLDPDLPDYWIYPLILLIAFLTTFFRLSFNKRFFDNAREQSPLRYLLAKSYLSQMGIVIFYTCLALVAYYFSDIQSALSTIYLILTPIALIYLVYSCPEERPVIVMPSSSESQLQTPGSATPNQDLHISRTVNQ